MLATLQEAKLPFALTVGPDTSAAVIARCCQGLAANTLAKRLRDWHQFSRYLVLEGVVPPFPRGEADVLDYLGVCAAEQAKTCFEDLVLSLRLMELAG